MQPPMPSLTATWHNDTYEAISPERPELSAKGKTVVVTGAGSGLGQGTAKAFAQAGAAKIVLVGRTQKKLEDTKQILSSFACETVVAAADVTDREALKRAAQATGQWDVLVISAGWLDTPMPMLQSDADDWWKAFEVNVKGAFLTATAFLKAKPADKPSILGVNAAMACMPASTLPNTSAYTSSKLAQARIFENLAAENPQIFVASIQPGIVDTDMYTKFGRPPFGLDTVELPSHFLVWLASPEAAFLRGRFAFANWDVNELKGRAEEIEKGTMLTTGVQGWPFAPAS